MNLRRKFKLLVDLPFLQKDSLFLMEDSTGHVYWYDGDKLSEYPLRVGLSGYLWLLATEPQCMELLEREIEDE